MTTAAGRRRGWDHPDYLVAPRLASSLTTSHVAGLAASALIATPPPPHNARRHSITAFRKVGS